MTTTTAIVTVWGVLARAPYSHRDASGALRTGLRLAHVNVRAINRGATEIDATSLIDVELTGPLPDFMAGLIDVGDRIEVTGTRTNHSILAAPSAVSIADTYV